MSKKFWTITSAIAISSLTFWACDGDTGMSPSRVETPVAVDTAAVPDGTVTAQSVMCENRFTATPLERLDPIEGDSVRFKFERDDDRWIAGDVPVHLAGFDTHGGTSRPGSQEILPGSPRVKTFNNQPVIYLSIPIPQDKCYVLQLDSACGEKAPRDGDYAGIDFNKSWTAKTEKCFPGRTPKPKPTPVPCDDQDPQYVTYEMTEGSVVPHHTHAGGRVKHGVRADATVALSAGTYELRLRASTCSRVGPSFTNTHCQTWTKDSWRGTVLCEEEIKEVGLDYSSPHSHTNTKYWWVVANPIDGGVRPTKYFDIPRTGY